MVTGALESNNTKFNCDMTHTIKLKISENIEHDDFSMVVLKF